MQKRVLLMILVVLLAALSGLAASSVTAQAALPAWGDLKAGEWNEIAPGGDTACAYGTPYRFFVRPAAEPTTKFMVYFAGGGACWDAMTCAPSFRGPDGNPIFVSAVPEGASATLTEGFFDYDNAANPVADYNALYIPVCTADVHTGNQVVEYEFEGEKYTMNFKGAVNAQAALDWAYANAPDPSQVFVSGCSAGAYGSIHHAPNIMSHYDGIPAVQLGDGGVGVVARGWTGLEGWGFFDTVADLPGLKDIDPAKFRINNLYKAAAAAFPENEFAQITSYLDTVQIGFFFLQGGGATPEEAGANWLLGMRSNLTGLNGSTANFDYYMYGGNLHCITPRAELYTYTVKSTPVVQWVSDLLDKKSEDVVCTECSQPQTVGQ